MNLKKILDNLLLETVIKKGKKYFVKSHKTNKIIGRKAGYSSKNEAIAAILGMKSKGGFYNLSSEEKKKRIISYKRNH